MCLEAMAGRLHPAKKLSICIFWSDSPMKAYSVQAMCVLGG